MAFETQLFVVSDIFGRTPALETLCMSLALTADSVEIIDPYGGIDHGFDSEPDAYTHFMADTGLARYADIIETHLSNLRDNVIIIAFSVGASAVWRLSGKNQFPRVKKAVCFYPSQIRHFPDVQPCIDMELIFPAAEPQFNVDEMILKQQFKTRVACIKTDGYHGFMNRLSDNFDAALYDHFVKYITGHLS